MQHVNPCFSPPSPLVKEDKVCIASAIVVVRSPFPGRKWLHAYDQDHNHGCHALLALPVQAEEALYYKSGQLVRFLRSWQGSTPTIAGRYEELLIDLYERKYLELQVTIALDLPLRQPWYLVQ